MYLALENLRSSYNVGAIFRTMSFFGLKNILLIGYSGRKQPGADELHDKVKKTALGAEADLKIRFVKDSVQLIKFCQKNKLKLVAIEQTKNSLSLNDWQPQKNSILVFGNEVNGVSQEVLAAANQIIQIPRLGKKGSLNVSVCAAIVIKKITCP